MTSKEELQSTYEELTIVNSELEESVKELEQLNNDLANFIASTEIATVFIDAHRNLKRYTPQATSIFNIINVDLNRPFSHISHNLQDIDLSATIEQVLDDLQPLECEVQSQNNHYFIMRARPYRTADDRIDGVVITWHDVTSIRHEKAQLTALFNAFPDAIVRVDKTSKHLNVKPSPSVPSIDEALIGCTFDQTTTPEHAAVAYAQLNEAFETGKVVIEHYQNALGITPQMLEVRTIVIDDNEAFQIVRDVTESENMARALRESKEQLELVLEGGELAFWDWKLPTNELAINDRWAHMLGYDPEEARAKLAEGWRPDAHPDDIAVYQSAITEHFAGNTLTLDVEHRLEHRDGHWLWVRGRGKVVARDDAGEPTRVVGVLIDISSEKATAEAIQDALTEKEMLLQELNHRVKNNLQMVASMLSIQSRQVSDPEMRDMLLANRARIQAISLVHKELYGENFDGYLNLETALQTISEGIASLTEDPAHHINIVFSGVPVRFAIDRAIPLGLVVGELVGNACKHAFPAWAEISKPKVSVKLMETDTMLILEIYDNGVGANHMRLKETADAKKDTSVSMGNQLIQGFVSQIDGTISQDTPYPDHTNGHVGTRFILHIPKQDSVEA
jgi:PAS domain S-box-containing protein